MANQTKTRKITHYRLLDHGIEHSQYFQGCGTAFTDYDNVATGCGDNFAEALDDALEMIAQQEDNVDLDALETEIHASREYLTIPSAVEQYQENDPDADIEYCELYYYVSIQYSVEKERASNVG